MSRVWRATTGHNKELPKLGTAMVVISFLFYKVLDHLTITVAYPEEKITSPLANCLVASNVAIECGRIFGNLRKEKNASEKRAT